MVTGWQVIDGSYYYFDASGAMTTNWQNVGGACYYMQLWKDGYWLASD